MKFSLRTILLLFVLTTSVASCSRNSGISISDYNPDEYFNPVQSTQQDQKPENQVNIPKDKQVPTQQETPQDLDANKRRGLQIQEIPGPENLRVLIFPHIGPYSVPQGKETVLDHAVLKSTANCELINEQTGAVLKQSNIILLNANELVEHTKIICEKSAKLQRDANLSVIEYRGIFHVHVRQLSSGKKYLQIVLHLPFEEYLKGVVPSEMPATWPMESLKAQSIAARTYALYQIQNFKAASADYDFDDTVLYQAFLGLNREHSRTNEAILLTKSQVLTFNQNPIQAFFSADSGGYTESAENVWMKHFPYCPSKQEVYDLSLVNNNWQYSSSIEKIETELRAANLIKGKAKLTDFQITKKSKSGRAIAIKLSFSDNSTKTFFGPDVQMAMKLRSNFIDLRKDVNSSSTFYFDGKGYGHGVGMNQWGARILAQSKSWNYQQILLFYFQL